MSKAILVLDKMPKSCSECPALKWTDMFCDASGIVPTLIEDIFTRPACCPLKEAPERIDCDKAIAHGITDTDYISGWNDCLTKILETEG